MTQFTRPAPSHSTLLPTRSRLISFSLLAASLLTLFLALIPQISLARASQGPARHPARPPDGERFDNLVRDEMFAGMAGDSAALDRAMKRCEEALAADPKDAQALVWHGSGLVFQAGQLFRSGDYRKGKEVILRGFKEMDDAVALAPGDIPVLIPRGASLLSYSRYSRDQQRAKPRLEQGLADYEKALSLQSRTWSSLPVHSRGELLSGLVEGWLRDGDAAKARSYAQRMVDDLPGTPYAARAKQLLAASAAPAQLDWQCIGCHNAMAR